MAEFELQRITLPTGVELNVAIAGDPANPPVVLLHGFPESHRTWRNQIPALARDHYVIAPDQRGFGHSSKPEGVENYTPDKPVGDLLALADHLGIGPFTLIGHDWGGAIAWMAALQNPQRIARLIIVNAPHPLVFQRSLFDDPDQRAASQYMTAFRNPDFEQFVERIGLETFFDQSFAKYTDAALLEPEKPAYLAEWSPPGALTAMLNWYRGSAVLVPAPGETPERPIWLDAPFPPVTQPTLVIWAMKDTALLPVQLDGLDRYVPDLTVVKIANAGHFVPWEKPELVTEAILEWLA
ncbi:pimeloyl-ACP methyl ester carboxylesterase [Sphingomonas kyeonggiensis]|uniref:alpha/beta fold hydrolase n=1 Tax=Sphingomonas kyeonggiensis TaxID=1268553 RepID=UPI002789317E|nr:alpha/beta hydrolase [Sphingomonas kyeonggiensis]MDQ0249442.1 pimeloyl-ACP methyl ester carboxylesterase [Sphingomonas kyeonggiensis]